MSAEILIAEDDDKQADLIRRYLEREGHRAFVVHDGPRAIAEALHRSLDLVVLDVMLPGANGFDVCRALRRDCDIPIVMLTARAAEDDVLLGLAVGADDYVIKPYSPRELVARIRTILRRAGRSGEADSEVHQVGGLVVDVGRHEVRLDRMSVRVTRGEFALLACLAAEPGRVYTRAQLLERTGGYHRDSTERTIDLHVMNLRRKLEADPRRPRYVLTVHGVGYKLACPKSTVEDRDGAA